MNDVDRIYETACEMMWEEENKPDYYEPQMQDAARNLRLATEPLDKALEYISDASANLNNTPMQENVDSIVNMLEDMICDIRRIARNYERGRRD